MYFEGLFIDLYDIRRPSLPIKSFIFLIVYIFEDYLILIALY